MNRINDRQTAQQPEILEYQADTGIARFTMPAFERHIGIDYSGAQTPTSSLKGLRIYLAQGDAPAEAVFQPATQNPRPSTSVGDSGSPPAILRAGWVC